MAGAIPGHGSDPVPAEPVTAGWRFGIRAKLAVAVGTAAAMILAAATLTWLSYSEIERLLAAVTRTNLPSVTNALKLSEATAQLAAAAPALDGSRSQFQRQSNFVALQQQIDHLLGLIDHLAGAAADPARVEDLRAMIAAFADNVVDRNILVDRRLQLLDRLRTQAESIRRLDAEVRGSVEWIGNDQVLAAAVLATTMLREAVIASDLVPVGDVRGAFEAQVGRMLVLSGGLGQGRAAERTRALIQRVSALGAGPDNVFELRTLLMMTAARLGAANDEGRDLVARTASAVGRLVSAAEAEAAENENRAEAAVSTGRWVLLVVAPLTFFGPLLFVWVYLGRSLVARLTGLASAMHRIVGGDFTTPIPGGGHDEIADMAAELVVFRDAMAKVRESTQALVESENRLRRILDTSPLALAISRVDDDCVVQVNPRWCELYRVVEDKAGQCAVSSFYADPLNRRRLVDLVREGGFVTGFECRMRTGDGHAFWAMLSAAEIEMDGATAVIVSSIDISRHKEEEAALAEAKRMAEEASQAKSLFLATMSHEIRTPMNGVLTMAQLLEDMPLSPEPREMARVIRDSAASLLTILNDILDFSKIEAGRLPLEQVELSPLDLVESVVELLAPRAREKGIGLIAQVDPTLPARLWGDPVRVRQIVTNLAGNAIKFTDSGYVRIAVRAADPARRPLRLEIAVSDTGIGLDAEQQSRLFEPFMQADPTISRRYGGTGLGLSICRRLVAMMDGEIGVASHPGRGATFHVVLPLEVADPAPESGPDLSGVTVLVLAEGAVAADSLGCSLGHLGAQVAVVASAEGAMAAVRAAAAAAWSYDAILLDSGEDGRQRIELSRRLTHEAAQAGGSRVVVMAPPGVLPAAEDLRAEPVFAVLPKPVRRRPLWRVVAAAGRGDAEGVAAEEEGTGELTAWVAPDIEEAAAAGALILVAEDNPTNTVVIRHLAARLGYAIEIVTNGVEAWTRLRQRDYGLLLTDCHMPEMDGYELTHRVRVWEEGSGRHLPIVALTADALTGTARRCLDGGMDAFLAKPIDLVQLEATLRRLLPVAHRLRRPRAVSAQLPSPGSAAVATEILDLAPMRRLFGSIGDDARAMMDLFITSTRPLLAEMARALADGDCAAAGEAAHAAKGAGGNAGAVEFTRLCDELERLCAADDRAGARDLLPRIETAFRAVALAVAEL